jgi:two-component system LytT family sensor kinase
MKLDQIKNDNKNKILIHSVIWGLFITTSLISISENFLSVRPDFYIQWSTGIFLFYLNYFYLVPELLLHKKYWSFLIVTLSIVTFFMTIRIVYFMPDLKEIIPPKMFDSADHELSRPRGLRRRNPYFIKLIPTMYYIFIIASSTIIKTLSEFNNNQQNKLIAEANRTATELNYLRKQTNPHFLFNALNSIYSLAYKKSDLVPDAIVTLSEMMRYMLYETDNKTVFLEKEINYIKNYIELQKLRLNNVENIYINIHGDTRNKYIEPLLLISFIENAFKYGTDYKGVTYVTIKITITNSILDFWIENKIEDHIKDAEHSGIGLTNIESRLNLLYPNTHQLTITETDNNYSVHLNLILEQKQDPVS